MFTIKRRTLQLARKLRRHFCMHMCMCMFMYMYVYMSFLCMTVYEYVYVHAYVYADVDVDVDVCVCIYICYIYTYAYNPKAPTHYTLNPLTPNPKKPHARRRFASGPTPG